VTVSRKTINTVDNKLSIPSTCLALRLARLTKTPVSERALTLRNRKPSLAILTAAILGSLAIAACSERLEETAAYQSACQGPPLRTIEQRNQAMEDGYDINRRFECVDKASFLAAEEQRAQWAAAHTPEAIAQREAEYERRRASYAEEQARAFAAAESAEPEVLPEVDTPDIDVNTATEAEIATVISVGPIIAAQIMAERSNRRFKDWADLVNRVAGLGAALSAYDASTCGLTVDHVSLQGAPPNAAMAALISLRRRKN
jgi:DNA uptake protein ComE-like DNA-binding protein